MYTTVCRFLGVYRSRSDIKGLNSRAGSKKVGRNAAPSLEKRVQARGLTHMGGGGLGRLAAGGSVGPPARWVATSNAKGGQTIFT